MSDSRLTVRKAMMALVVSILLTGAVGALVYLRPTISVSVHRELAGVGPEAAPILMLERGASLEDIKAAVLKSGRHVDEVSCLGVSLLSYAVKTRRPDVVRWAIERGANVNGKGPVGVPLAEAIRQHDLEMVRALIAFGADPDYPMNPELGITPRWIAESDPEPNAAVILALPPRKTP